MSQRVLGPYPIGRQWRVVVVGAGGERDSRFYPTEEEAQKVIRAVRKDFAKASTKTMQEALDAYELYLRYEKQNKPGSVDDTIYHLGVFFPDGDLRLCDLSARTCEGYYEPFGRARRGTASRSRWTATGRCWRQPRPSCDGARRVRAAGSRRTQPRRCRAWDGGVTASPSCGSTRPADEHGASAHVVASSLGHESISTTLQSYAKPEAVEGAKQRRVLTVLQGGELAS